MSNLLGCQTPYAVLWKEPRSKQKFGPYCAHLNSYGKLELNHSVPHHVVCLCFGVWFCLHSARKEIEGQGTNSCSCSEGKAKLATSDTTSMTMTKGVPDLPHPQPLEHTGARQARAGPHDDDPLPLFSPSQLVEVDGYLCIILSAEGASNGDQLLHVDYLGGSR